MKKFIRSVLVIIILTMVILGSYERSSVYFNASSELYKKQKEEIGTLTGTIQKQIEGWLKNPSSFSLFENEQNEDQEEPVDEKPDFSEYRAVWISYQEFNSYRNSVDENNASNFRKFFQSVLERCEKLHFNTVIVQVRPFGDALYPSKYFPWAACISGAKGEDPGYNPLKIMVKEAHKKGMHIEAWINPYRIAVDQSVDILPANDPAKRWASSKNEKRNVLSYEGDLYYNPASEDVRNLIVNGVEEIVKNYDVDGIHMDDYFYPQFDEMNYEKTFDSKEYTKYKKNNVNKKTISIAKWRRNNVNELVRELYQTCHNYGVKFGISPAGNLENLRSDYEYYVDIDRWMNQKGYIDYVIPQIYWGFTNVDAPFREVLNRWSRLAEDSPVKLYVGLQLYKIGTRDTSESEYKELQSYDFLKHELEEARDTKEVQGFSLFSYQYLDLDNERYHLAPMEVETEQKTVLNENIKYLEYLQY